MNRSGYLQRRRFRAVGALWCSLVRWLPVGGACLMMLPAPAAAQATLRQTSHISNAIDELPEAPQVVQLAQATSPAGQATDGRLKAGAISGTVLDSNGAVIAGASVTLENMASHEKRAGVSDDAGYFSFTSVPDGLFQLTIAAAGFAGWSETSIPMQSGADLDLPRILLKVKAATTDVQVVFSQHELAEEQVSAQEKQRVLGIFPNFYASYVWNAAPLTTGQKFRLAWRSSIDWEAFAASASIAGVQQASDSFEGYGQGASGFAKRFGASYADGIIGTMIGGVLLPSIFRQDPRYFYKATGTIPQRALYAMATTVICRGDSGNWQPNYSNVLGNLAAGGISNLYYPKGQQNGAATTIDNALIGTAAGAAGALIQEFLLHRITPSVKATQKP